MPKLAATEDILVTIRDIANVGIADPSRRQPMLNVIEALIMQEPITESDLEDARLRTGQGL